MGHQSYVLLCSEIIKSMTWLGKLSIKFVTSSKMKKIINHFCHILETLNKNYHNFFLVSWCICIKDSWGTKVMYCYVVKSSNLWLGWALLILSIPSRTSRYLWISIRKRIRFPLLQKKWMNFISGRSRQLQW